MSNLVSSMNDVLEDWKKEHDLFHAIPFAFSIESGWLCFHKHMLCPAEEDLLFVSAEFDTETISFFFNTGRSVSLHIAWPEDLPPEIGSVSVNYRFQPVDEHQVM